MRFLGAILVAAAATPAGAQVTVATAELKVPGYYDQLKALVNTQIVGYRVVAERRQWDSDKPQLTGPLGVDRRECIHGNDMWILRATDLAANAPASIDKASYVRVVTPDAYYQLNLGAAGKYTVSEHGTEWKKSDGYRRAVFFCPAAVQLYQPGDVKGPAEWADDSFEGRRTLRLTVHTSNGATEVTHVDRKTGQHLYSEADRIYAPGARGGAPGKSVRRTEYREDGGKWWPTRQESYQVAPDGTKQMMSETTILEYAPYTPAADELDMEKQFGVKPIPHEPRPESAVPRPVPARRSWAWLYAAAGVLAAAAVLVALRRRRRGRRAAA